MPSCSMASAACGFGLTPNLTCSPSPSTSRSSNMLRLVVVRAAREAEPPSTTEAPLPQATTKPPSIGPKRGTKVKILKRESYWHNGMGSVVAVDQDSKTRHPVVVRFNKVNYANVSTNYYVLDEIQEL
ncbi:hypothetical protein ACSBR2_032209 [Camellia fascicularis]